MNFFKRLAQGYRNWSSNVDKAFGVRRSSNNLTVTQKLEERLNPEVKRERLRQEAAKRVGQDLTQLTRADRVNEFLKPGLRKAREQWEADERAELREPIVQKRQEEKARRAEQRVIRAEEKDQAVIERTVSGNNTSKAIDRVLREMKREARAVEADQAVIDRTLSPERGEKAIDKTVKKFEKLAREARKAEEAEKKAQREAEKEARRQAREDRELEKEAEAFRKATARRESEANRKSNLPSPVFETDDDIWSRSMDETGLTDSDHWVPYWELKKSLKKAGIINDTPELILLEEIAVRREGYELRADKLAVLKKAGLR